MDIYKSKELAEKLSGKEVVVEAIEGLYLSKEELPEEISMILEEKEDYLVYINPVEEDKTIAHVLTEDEEVLVSFLSNEEGRVEEVYCEARGMEEVSHMGS